jgi:hypothetical protein
VDTEEALELCDDILIDLDELPDAADEFAESVREKVESMSEWIQEHDKVTPKMVKALKNMKDGVARWLENDD